MTMTMTGFKLHRNLSGDGSFGFTLKKAATNSLEAQIATQIHLSGGDMRILQTVTCSN